MIYVNLEREVAATSLELTMSFLAPHIMKKSLIVAAMMLLTAAAQAQTITASDVMATYQNAVNNSDSKYCYNADVELTKKVAVAMPFRRFDLT